MNKIDVSEGIGINKTRVSKKIYVLSLLVFQRCWI